MIVVEKPVAGMEGEATATLVIHGAEPNGFCRGCLDAAARIVWFPCPQANWAAQVLAAQPAGVQ